MPAKKLPPKDERSAADASIVNIKTKKPLTDKQKAAFAKRLANGIKHQKDLKAARIARGDGECHERPTRFQRLVKGELTVQDLDMEELAQMRCRDYNGTFAGRPPKVPAKLARDMRAEFMSRAGRGLDSGLEIAINELQKIIASNYTNATDKLRGIQILLERCLGRPIERVQIKTDETWDETFESVKFTMTDDDEETA